MARLLVVEDEETVRTLVADCLRREGHDVLVAASGEQALSISAGQRLDGILLDVRLPGRDGFDVLQSLRRAGIDAPVMYVSGCSTVEDRVRGLDLGADDYIAKPFALAELIARVRALVRRKGAGSGEVQTRKRVGELELDLVRRCLRMGEAEVVLTNREFDLLHFLMSHPGRAITRDEIMESVWREKRSPDLMTNVVDVYVNGLRKKLAEVDPRLGRMLVTVRGTGYELRPPAEETRPAP